MVYKNFPLRNHRFAFRAAEAALAAAPQGKFWEFHDELFKDYSKLNEEKIQEIARTLHLDMPQFEAELHNPAIDKQIRDDYQQGISLDVRGVPTVFINGRRLKDRSMEGFLQMIDQELSRLGKKSDK